MVKAKSMMTGEHPHGKYEIFQLPLGIEYQDDSGEIRKTRYIRVSTSTALGRETMIFPANKSGAVLGWMELLAMWGTCHIDAALGEFGYERWPSNKEAA